MPIYSFRCPECNLHAEALLAIDELIPAYPCPECGPDTLMRRRFGTFSVRAGLQPHFNVATGAYVTSDRQLKDEFARVSDERSERTGIEHRFVPVDPRDRDECGVTDEGLEETYRRQHDAGQRPSSLWL